MNKVKWNKNRKLYLILSVQIANWAILYANLQYKIGRDFLDMRYDKICRTETWYPLALSSIQYRTLISIDLCCIVNVISGVYRNQF